ncbi:cell wall-binding protein [Desulfosporosinus acidiphilus SJ4]|uniref:Cell wall-binding protein n=1 Tax=Desulfosporosinus acidiphilus (strain DSM 22704 / JCM 16185 / SJ4) TaxID=646529 RepID=I4D4K6_DESAJ|nr:cell wall-binding repeat-containing protein [Desulfosporosinus acidiphilus]AFM40730.1 cell wall-binding protein [Desulfosporosinus acidiphilus SJ4]
MLNKKVSFIIILAVILSFFIPKNAHAATKKLSGLDRYATSAAIAEDGWQQSNYGVLTYGKNYPDAIIAAPLAEKYKAPILLTETDIIPEDTLNTVRRLKITNMIIIGGTGVISSSVENQLSLIGIKTERLCGRDRYETSVIVANQLDAVHEIAVVTGEDFTDALSIAPIAAKRNMPILLVPHNVIPDLVKEYIKLNPISQIYVIGAGSSLSESLVSELPNVEQINGEDKYQRNLAVIDKFKNEMDLTTIYLTSGESFDDGLSGSALAALNCNPLLLVGDNCSSQKNYLENNAINKFNIVVLGGLVKEQAIIFSPNVDFEEKTISEVTNVKSTDITKIIVYDGRGGLNKPISVENKQKINQFMGYLDNYIIKKDKNPLPSVGWIHKAVFYDHDKEVMDIVFTNPIIINQTYYDIIKGDLDTQTMDQFLKSVDPSYES